MNGCVDGVGEASAGASYGQDCQSLTGCCKGPQLLAPCGVRGKKVKGRLSPVGCTKKEGQCSFSQRDNGRGQPSGVMPQQASTATNHGRGVAPAEG